MLFSDYPLVLFQRHLRRGRADRELPAGQREGH